MTTQPDRPDDPNAADLVRAIVLELEPPGAVDEVRVASRTMLARASAHGLAVILRDFVPDAAAREQLIAGVLDRVGSGIEARAASGGHPPCPHLCRANSIAGLRLSGSVTRSDGG